MKAKLLCVLCVFKLCELCVKESLNRKGRKEGTRKGTQRSLLLAL
jgi:hypothetical protein